MAMFHPDHSLAKAHSGNPVAMFHSDHSLAKAHSVLFPPWSDIKKAESVVTYLEHIRFVLFARHYFDLLERDMAVLGLLQRGRLCQRRV